MRHRQTYALVARIEHRRLATSDVVIGLLGGAGTRVTSGRGLAGGGNTEEYKIVIEGQGT